MAAVSQTLNRGVWKISLEDFAHLNIPIVHGFVYWTRLFVEDSMSVCVRADVIFVTVVVRVVSYFTIFPFFSREL